MTTKPIIKNHKKALGILGTFLGFFLFFLIMKQFQK